MKSKTCCFTGHRKLPEDKIADIINNLNIEVDRLISMGVTDFISGGALGFDQIAAELILRRKEENINIRLIFALPCKRQEQFWQAEQKKLYKKLLKKADEIIYVSLEFDSLCMRKRNYYLVDNADFCICAMINRNSGTGQTVRYARKTGISIINVVDIKN